MVKYLPGEFIVLGLIRSFNGPVDKEVLQWEVNFGENRDQYNDLGPIPRTHSLYQIIGNLVDKNLVVLTTEGLTAQKQTILPRMPGH